MDKVKRSDSPQPGPRRQPLKIAAVIPAYNEADSIVEVLGDLRTHRPDIVPIVVDDGSTDATATKADLPGVVLLKLCTNLGIGGAVQTGLRHARNSEFDIVVQFDGDGQHRASEVAKIVAPIMAGEADVVVGSRFLEGESSPVGAVRIIGIRLLRLVISILTGKRFTDTTSGFRAYSAPALEFLAEVYPQDYPEPEAIVDLNRNGFRVIEVSVQMRERSAGKSSIGVQESMFYMIKVVLATLIAATRRSIK